MHTRTDTPASLQQAYQQLLMLHMLHWLADEAQDCSGIQPTTAAAPADRHRRTSAVCLDHRSLCLSDCTITFDA